MLVVVCCLHTQFPERQEGIADEQTVHAAPQWVGSEVVSTQLPPHSPCPVGQLAAQANTPSVRQPYMQDIDMPAVHIPLPLQREAAVALLLLQVAAAQEMALVG
jgi:hypothetical protein